MNNMLLNLYVKFQDLKSREEGQDLVEYALVVALIAFGATAGMTSLATGINTAFSNVSSQLGSAHQLVHCTIIAGHCATTTRTSWETPNTRLNGRSVLSLASVSPNSRLPEAASFRLILKLYLQINA